MTGVQLASGTLSTVLGGTQWVASAIQGFIQFEDVASQTIWRIEGQMTRAFSSFGRLARELPQLASAAAMVMPQAFGGMGFGGSVMDWMGEGSASQKAWQGMKGVAGFRGESRRFNRQGPTELQKDEKRLERLNQLLSQRNRSASDYAQILQKAVVVEQRISQETKLQAVMRQQASGAIARDMRKRDIALKKEIRDKRTARRQAFQDRAEAFEMEQAEMRGRMFMGTETQALMAPGRQGRVRRDVWARYQRRLASRRQ